MDLVAEQGFFTVRWHDGAVELLDQRLLPGTVRILRLSTAADVAAAIRDMAVRGAPAIGVTAALGLALGARELGDDPERFDGGFAGLCDLFAATRPTAKNLFWAIDRMRALVAGMRGVAAARIREALLDEAQAILEEDVRACRTMGAYGAQLVADGATVLTHCNAGALATAGYGSALGVIRGARDAGKAVRVLADETRPFLQGARLTAWELQRAAIPVTVIADGMAASLMRAGEIGCVVVGADRIAANGDVANKIGTYSIAVLARVHAVPFYVAAPSSTFDLDLGDGSRIPIEERSAAEMTHFGGMRIVPEGVPVRHPAFDVTPAVFVSAIVTELGVLRAPYRTSIARALGKGL
ncbi:MAG: S-methyl-5-thioribose-1-phosphate isomerase [Deltaproteobacteria bacterium]|nr:S-methyl-5-thioribose-1-phosphate isomerase [Deltaproteobacteria bacterium]